MSKGDGTADEQERIEFFADQLARKERLIVETLYSLSGAATLSDIRGALPREQRQVLQIILNKLVEKGAVKREGESGAYVYRVTVAKQAAWKSSLARAVKIFEKNNPIELLDDLVTFGFVSKRDLRRASKKDRK
jgi:predicted transcriptional regulator